MRTQVGIVGAGPAGLMLSHLLHLAGIHSIVIEDRSRAYCEARVRGVGERMQRERLVHDGIKIAFGGALHHIDFRKLVDKVVTVYGQQEVVKDLIARRLADGGEILFEVDGTSVQELDTDRPSIRFRHGGKEREIACDFVGGCDGFHGICRTSMPRGVLRAYEREYPFAWLGILGEAKPVDEKLIYAYHAHGFALFSMRSPGVVRYYLQCAPDEDVNLWPDGRIWEELETRLGGAVGKPLETGTILQKAVTPMRSFVCEPMQFGRLYLAGDAAHIVPPTGAKGMNLALADVCMLARAIRDYYALGRTDRLESYSRTCLRRVWKAQRFSWWMTQMLHRYNFDEDFDMRRQLAEIDYVTGSTAAATALAENYAGLPLELDAG
jgi:p-hydroxybenzoate 3-monooxygenase